MSMKSLPRFLATALLLAAASLRAGQLGDPAPPLSVSEWIRGDAVSIEESKGRKIVVVEFWATWCPPCRASIPHLTALQKKYADRDVVVVGISSEDAATVRPFVQKMGGTMEYRVGVDSNNRTAQAYLQAYGKSGIPCAFIVDREGRVAWVGHPMAGLEEKLAQLAAAAAPQDSLDAKPADGQERLLAFAEAAKRESEAAPPAPDGARLDARRGEFNLQRTFQEYYRAVTGKGDAARAAELAARLETVTTGDPEALNEMAWALLTDEAIKVRNLPLALHLARAAFEGSGGGDPGVLDTYARALFDNGKAEEAVLRQKRAIELTADPDKKAALAETLRQYEKR